MQAASSNGSSIARGYAVGLLGAAVLSTAAIFIRYLSQAYALPARVLATWRKIFVVAALLPILGAVRPGRLRVKSRDVGYLIGHGLILSMFNALWTTSVALSGAAVATTLGCSPADGCGCWPWRLVQTSRDLGYITSALVSYLPS